MLKILLLTLNEYKNTRILPTYLQGLSKYQPRQECHYYWLPLSRVLKRLAREILAPPLYFLNKDSMNTNHYPDQERCKKLTEIGFPMTVTVWSNFYNSEAGGRIDAITTFDEYDKVNPQWVCPSVMEMLDVIPEFINYETDYEKNGKEKTVKRKCRIEITKLDLWYIVKIRDEDFSEPKDWYGWQWKAFGGTLPNALADLIFWLHENSYLTIWKSE